jgi:hypothetical protein
MLMKIEMPHDEFNEAVEDGTSGEKMKQILDALQPEHAWFMEMNGQRTGILIVDIAEASQIPHFCEPWFLTFNADVSLHPCMTPEDLEKAGLDQLGHRWG